MKDYKRLTNEELYDFTSRVVVQLEPKLTQQVTSLILELCEYRTKIENGTLVFKESKDDKTMKEYKRLTIKCEVGIGLTETSGNIVNDYEKLLTRLADLEDKIERGELVENKVVTYINMARSGNKTLVDKALKYDELKTKIENGTLIELPCKVGDTVYRVKRTHCPCGDAEDHCNCKKRNEPCIVSFDIRSISIGKSYIMISGIDNDVLSNELGKTIFLTKAEAEAKLKELKGE